MIKTITIVGGGFAGWYTAGVLQHKCPGLKITIIESPSIARLKVGESLGFESIYAWQNYLGLETDHHMMRETGATYKFGAVNGGFYNTGEAVAHGKFFNPKVKSLANFFNKFDYPDFYEPWSSDADDIGVLEAWMLLNSNTGKTFEDLILETSDSALFSQEPVMPYNKNNTNILRQDDGYSYHMDAEEMVAFLKHLVYSRGGVTHLTDTVREVKLDEQGNIAGLLRESNLEVQTSDLYIDCTGFARILGKHVANDSWQDRPDHNNSAWVCPSKYTDPHTEMVCGTGFNGEDYGWRFQVNLYHRRGNGYVFNSEWFDSDLVKQRLEQVVDGNQLADPKQIKWKPGYYSKSWNKNCILMGVAAGFIDPWDAPTFSEHTRSLEDFMRGYQLHTEGQQDVDTFRETFNQARSKGAAERDLRLKCSHALSNRAGPYWDRAREMGKKLHIADEIRDIILERKPEISSRLTHYWQQIYIKIAVQTGQDTSKWDFKPITVADAEMANAYFAYNRARNTYIKQQQWPNTYEWLKANRFGGATSQEIYQEFQGRK
jgi:tryptophan halogenase